MIALISIILLSPLYASLAANSTEKSPSRQHGLSMLGNLKYPANFTHYSYTNRDAPKGGILNLGVQGTFSSLNPLNIRGGSAAGIRGFIYESLLSRALDESFSLYGLIAEAVTVPDDRSSITFHLNKAAKFSDGTPITADDVIFTHDLLKKNGRPNHRTYYSKVIKVETPDQHTVKFTFNDSGDREMPLIMGLMPILPKHAMTIELFSETSLKTPIGSGPYQVKSIDPGKFITYQHNKNYWGKDLPVNKGRHNFNTIKYTYYRDTNSMFEAFKKGLHDLKYEGNPGKWSSSYNFNAINDGRVLKKQFPLAIPSGMTGLVFNTRRKQFKDQRVRKALNFMFNFEDTNRKLFHGLYTRTQSYFDRSILSSIGNKPDAIEDDILEPTFKTKHPKLYEGSYTFPQNKTKGLNRRNIRNALKLMKEAGYILKNGQLMDSQTKIPFHFEIMTVSKSQEALLLNFVENLKLIGVSVDVRQVDSTAYQKRKIAFDFDMFQNDWSGSLSPGNEQLFRWSSKQADTQGSYNFPGIKDPNVDKAISALLAAKDPETFTSSVRSLDRLLLSGDYVIPLYHLKHQWLAHWAYLGHPEAVSNYGTILDCWWDKRAQ